MDRQNWTSQAGCQLFTQRQEDGKCNFYEYLYIESSYFCNTFRKCGPKNV